MGALLHDAQLDYFGDVFIRLNAEYGLTKQQFFFKDFLVNPDEESVHLYFANKSLLANRRFNAVIALSMFLSNPQAILQAALEVDCAYREAEGLQSEQKRDRQAIAAMWISVANLACFQEANEARFERKHRVVVRDNKQVEPMHRCYRHERKQAGGKR
jgi:hypothetical protein